MGIDKHAQGVVDTIREGLVALDLSLRIRGMNESFCRMTGISRAEAEGQPLFEIAGGTWDTPELRDVLDALPTERIVHDLLLELDFHRIGRRVLLLNARLLEDHPLLVIAIEDVTALVETGNKLREQEQRFRRLVEASAQILWTTDAEGLVVGDSPSWRTFTGQSVEEWWGEGWADAVHPDDRDQTIGSWRRHVESSSPVDAEFRLWHEASQTWRWINARAVPLRSGDGTIQGWIGMNLDVDDRKKAEGRLREMACQLTLAEHRERRLIAAVLHEEIQQRLAAITIKLQVTQTDVRCGQEETVVEHLEVVGEWLKACQSMVHNLAIDMSPPILQDEGLPEALSWLASRMKKLCGLDLELRADRAFPRFQDDLRVLLYRGVHELLSNVARHAGTDLATVELLVKGDHAEISVSDGGVGFDPDSRIVERYREGGFGLFVLRERLQLVGGTLAIDSSPGEGTRATICIPLPSGTGSMPKA